MLHRTLHPLGLAVLGLSVALTAACDREDPGLPTAVTAVDELAASAETSDAEVVLLSNPAIVVGQSHLTRNQRGLRGNVRTSGLTPGDVVTMWFTTFQNPDDCVGVCNSPPEDFGPGHGSTALGGGGVVPSSGKLTLAGKLDVGDAVIFGGDFGGPVIETFENVTGSEVHLVIRTHGPVIPGMLDEQLSSFTGGCSVNACANLQVAVYQP